MTHTTYLKDLPTQRALEALLMLSLLAFISNLRPYNRLLRTYHCLLPRIRPSVAQGRHTWIQGTQSTLSLARLVLLFKTTWYSTGHKIYISLNDDHNILS